MNIYRLSVIKKKNYKICINNLFIFKYDYYLIIYLYLHFVQVYMCNILQINILMHSLKHFRNRVKTKFLYLIAHFLLLL